MGNFCVEHAICIYKRKHFFSSAHGSRYGWGSGDKPSDLEEDILPNLTLLYSSFILVISKAYITTSNAVIRVLILDAQHYFWVYKAIGAEI